MAIQYSHTQLVLHIRILHALWIIMWSYPQCVRYKPGWFCLPAAFMEVPWWIQTLTWVFGRYLVPSLKLTSFAPWNLMVLKMTFRDFGCHFFQVLLLLVSGSVSKEITQRSLCAWLYCEDLVDNFGNAWIREAKPRNWGWFIHTWYPKQPFFKWMFGETIILYVMIWNHPIETIMQKTASLEFQVAVAFFFNLQKKKSLHHPNFKATRWNGGLKHCKHSSICIC